MQPQSIQQLHVFYDKAQDRLLMKAAVSQSAEVRFWLTYRIARQLFRLLNQEARLPVAAPITVADSSPSAAVRQFESEAQAQQQLAALDFETAYTARETLLGGQELLVTDVVTISVNQQLNSLQLVCANQMQIQFGMTPTLVLAMARMLMLACQEAHWPLNAGKNEPLAESSIVLASPTDKQVYH